VRVRGDSTAPYSNAHRESGRKIDTDLDSSAAGIGLEQRHEGPSKQQEGPVAPGSS